MTGIGGVFLKARDPERLRAWYREHLGVDADRPGVNFLWREADHAGRFGRTVWSAFPADTRYFGPGDQDFMIHYRVRDPRRAAGQAPPAEHPQLGKTEEYWYGRFAWVVDGEGNRVERWEPDHFSPREFERRMKTIEQPR